MRAAHWPNWVPQLWPPPQPSSPPSGQATPVQGTQLPKSRPQPSQDMRPSPDQLQAFPLPLEPPLLAPGDRAGCPSLTTVCNSSVYQHSRLGPQSQSCPCPLSSLWTQTPGPRTARRAVPPKPGAPSAPHSAPLHTHHPRAGPACHPSGPRRKLPHSASERT